MISNGLISPTSKKPSQKWAYPGKQVCFDHVVDRFRWILSTTDCTKYSLIKTSMLASNSVWDRMKFRNRTLLPVTTVIPHYYSATIIDRFIRSPVELNLFRFNLLLCVTMWPFSNEKSGCTGICSRFILFQVDAKSNSSRSDSICNWNFGNFSLLRQEMIQNKPKSIASKLKIGIQVSAGIFSVNFYDDSRVFFVYLDSFQVLRI